MYENSCCGRACIEGYFEESLWERGRGHRGIRGGGGDKYSFNKSIVECYNYYI